MSFNTFYIFGDNGYEKWNSIEKKYHKRVSHESLNILKGLNAAHPICQKPFYPHENALCNIKQLEFENEED